MATSLALSARVCEWEIARAGATSDNVYKTWQRTYNENTSVTYTFVYYMVQIIHAKPF